MSGTGKSDLDELLKDLRPRLSAEQYVFASVDAETPMPEAFAIVREDEGTTLVMEEGQAKRLGLHYDFVAARITLGIDSALDAVGLTAVVTSALAGADISCNVIAGARHDHLFVPAARADDAVAILDGLSVGQV